MSWPEPLLRTSEARVASTAASSASVAEDTTGRGGGPLGRSYRRAQRAAARANSRARHVEAHASVLSESLDRYDAAERTLAFAPGLAHAASVLAVAVEIPLGAALGWDIAGGTGVLGVTGTQLTMATVSALGFGGTFGLAGLLIGESSGLTYGRWLAIASGRSLKPSFDDLHPARRHLGLMPRRHGVPLVVVGVLGMLAFAAYFAVNTLRATLLETASMRLPTLSVAALGTVVPAGLGLLKAHWYAHEAAVDHHRKSVAWRRAARSWRRAIAVAVARAAAHRAVRLHVVARAVYAGAVSSSAAPGHERAVLDVLHRELPLIELETPALPEALRGEKVVAAAESLIRAAL